MKNCDECKKNYDNQPDEYVLQKDVFNWLKRINKRLFIICIVQAEIIISMLIGILVYESQFQNVVITAEQQAETGNNYAVGGDLIGETEGYNQEAGS